MKTTTMDAHTEAAAEVGRLSEQIGAELGKHQHAEILRARSLVALDKMRAVLRRTLAALAAARQTGGTS